MTEFLSGAECQQTNGGLRQKTSDVSLRIPRACKKLANGAIRSTHEEGVRLLLQVHCAGID